MSETQTLPAAPPPRGRHREAWVGLFVIAGVVAVLATLFTLTEPAMFRGRYLITTVIDNAGGIRKGDPVQMLGVNIGRVRSFDITPKGVAIRLEIEGEYQIPADSTVELQSQGLLGGMSATVIPGQATAMLRGGAILPGRAAGGIMQAADDLAAKADKALDKLREALSDKTVSSINEGAAAVPGLLRDLQATTSEQRKHLDALMSSLRASASHVEKVTSGPELERTLKQIDELSAKANKTTESLERSSQSLETILGRMERGEGTLGKLSKDPALYDNANRTVENLHGATNDLRSLLQDLQKNPKRYVRLSLF